MKKEPGDSRSDEQRHADQVKGVWLEDPYTKFLLAKEHQALAAALQNLIGKCHDSTDPNVVRSYSNYITHKRRIELLTKGET